MLCFPLVIPREVFKASVHFAELNPDFWGITTRRLLKLNDTLAVLEYILNMEEDIFLIGWEVVMQDKDGDWNYQYMYYYTCDSPKKLEKYKYSEACRLSLLLGMEEIRKWQASPQDDTDNIYLDLYLQEYESWPPLKDNQV